MDAPAGSSIAPTDRATGRGVTAERAARNHRYPVDEDMDHALGRAVHLGEGRPFAHPGRIEDHDVGIRAWSDPSLATEGWSAALHDSRGDQRAFGDGFEHRNRLPFTNPLAQEAGEGAR